MTSPNLSQCLARIRHVSTQAERTMADVVREMERTNPHKKIDVRV